MATPNKENIRKWVDALRSGEYTQDTGQLRSSHGFCCLGVACEVAIKNGVRLVYDDDYQGYHQDSEIYLDEVPDWHTEGSTLPFEVQEWLGFIGDDPYIDREECKTATTANDELNLSLVEIADYLEGTYLSDLK